jgi:type II secretory ATPase GspE/PulE/Tfp pilus assembly ATPase PilB-like protein
VDWGDSAEEACCRSVPLTKVNVRNDFWHYCQLASWENIKTFMTDFRSQLARQLRQLDPQSTEYATQFVDLLLTAAQQARASDMHLRPTASALDLRMRINGVLTPIGEFPSGTAANVVTRLKVLAELLTYRTDVPQEGRIRDRQLAVEMRVSTFPTLFGEQAVVRLFGAQSRYERIGDLGLPEPIAGDLHRLIVETSGAILITGPAGSGKTTTLYACLREIAQASLAERSVVTLEDPIESVLPGITQSQVNPAAGFDLATGLRSIVRQDPQVIMIGEIRDRTTAEIALQAALTGQLLLSSFHAGSAAGAISRLLDMGIEPYALRSGVLAIISQRLLRRLCDCGRQTSDPADWLGLNVPHAKLPIGCPNCLGTGYVGRILIAEMLRIDQTGIPQAILARNDAQTIERIATTAGMTTQWQQAEQAVAAGLTSPAEVRRVLGFGNSTLTT